MEIEIGKEILYLTYEDIAEIGLSGQEIFNIVECALAEHGKKNYEMPAKIGLHPLEDSIMHAMPAFVPRYAACGIKWAEAFPDNHKLGLPQISGLLILNDQNTGFPIAVMDAVWITAKRTATVTAVACKYLARKSSEQLGLIGTGVQGREHLKAISKTLPNLKRAIAYDLRTDVLEDFVESAREDLPIEVVAAKDYREVVESSDIVVSATVIRRRPDPLIRDEWIAKSGVFIAPVDFDSLWEFSTMNRMDKFVVDSIEEMEYFRGIGYLPYGLPKIHAELGEVVCGSKPGREKDDENIMDLNIGMGVEDVTVAKEIYTRALENGFGRKLPL